jgi:hypothetical protein
MASVNCDGSDEIAGDFGVEAHKCDQHNRKGGFELSSFRALLRILAL